MTLIRNHKRLTILIGGLICVCVILSIYFRPMSISELIGSNNIEHIHHIRITRVNTFTGKTLSENTITDYDKCKDLMKQLRAFPLIKQIRWNKILATGEPAYTDILERVELSITTGKNSNDWKQWDFYICNKPHGIKIFETDSSHENNEYFCRVGTVWGGDEEKFYNFLSQCSQESP